MTALELLNELQTLDIRLECAGDKLHVNAPLGALTPELRSMLVEQKAALLALLAEGTPQTADEEQACPEEIPTEDEISIECCVCGAMVECYSEQGDAYCETHWVLHLLPHPSPVMGRDTPLTSVQEIYALAAQWDVAPPAQLVLDLETTGLNPRTNKVITLAFGLPGNVTIIDLRGYYHADPIHQQAWRKALQQLLQRDILWIGHNLKFDWSFLAQQFGVQLERVYDTMLVEKLLHAGGHVSASLQASAARYNIVVTKEQRSWFIDLWGLCRIHVQRSAPGRTAPT